MRKIIRNNSILVIAFLTIFSPILNANDSTHMHPSQRIEMKYAGTLKNDPVFRLSVSGNGAVDDYTISVTDTNGNQLYQENIKAENFSKTYLLNTEELGDELLRFEIISHTQRKKVVYELSSISKIVSETNNR